MKPFSTKRTPYRWMKRPKEQEIHRSKWSTTDKRLMDLIFYEKKPRRSMHVELDPKKKRFVSVVVPCL